MSDISFSLKGKKALISGGNRGIGKAVARAFAKAGAGVMLMARNQKSLEQVVKQITDGGGEAYATSADVSSLSDIESAVQETVGNFGQIDILVNAAAGFLLKPALKTQPDEWREIMEVNLNGLFFLSQSVARHMKSFEGGSIINFASYLAFRGTTRLATECATKAAVVQLTKALAVEWAQYNIRVNAIAPGLIETGLQEKVEGDKNVVEKLIAKIPLKRLGEPEEVAGAVIFLASDASSYITGETLLVDGGISIK